MGLKQWDAFYEEDEDFDIHAYKVKRRDDLYLKTLREHNVTFDDAQVDDAIDHVRITCINPYAILR